MIILFLPAVVSGIIWEDHISIYIIYPWNAMISTYIYFIHYDHHTAPFMVSQIYPNGHCLNYHLQRPATFALRPHDVAAAGRGPRPFARPAACCAWCFWHVRGTKPRCFHRIYSAKREFNEPNGGIIMQIEWDFT